GCLLAVPVRSVRADVLVAKASDVKAPTTSSFEPLDEGPELNPIAPSGLQPPCLPLLVLTAVVPWNVGQEESENNGSKVTSTPNVDPKDSGGSEGNNGGNGGSVAEVPEPASVLLGVLGSSFLGMGSVMKRRKTS